MMCSQFCGSLRHSGSCPTLALLHENADDVYIGITYQS
ncbi:hypothetical protein M3J09_006023 [Ascochyta lentis]